MGSAVHAIAAREFSPEPITGVTQSESFQTMHLRREQSSSKRLFVCLQGQLRGALPAELVGTLGSSPAESLAQGGVRENPVDCIGDRVDGMRIEHYRRLSANLW